MLPQPDDISSSSPGRLLVGGDFEQEASGELVIEIGGRRAGEEYDQLSVAGKATLGGTLKIIFQGGFVPRPGDELSILDAASISGQFDEIVVEGLPPELQASFNPATGTIDVAWLTPPAAALQIEGPNLAVRGQPLVFVFAVEPADEYRYEIDWDGDGTVDEIHVTGDPLALTHIYRTAGGYQISATISTTDGSESASATQDVEVHAVLLAGGKLYVGGTTVPEEKEDAAGFRPGQQDEFRSLLRARRS